jgi:hypothetical protein
MTRPRSPGSGGVTRAFTNSPPRVSEPRPSPGSSTSPAAPSADTCARPASPTCSTGAGPGRPSRLDPFVAYLHQRLAEGATNATALFREIADRGYHGSPGSVRAYLKPLRELAAQLSDSGPIPAPVPKPRKISSRICTALATFVTRTDAPEGTPRDIDSGEQHCHHSVRDLSTRPSRRPL